MTGAGNPAKYMKAWTAAGTKVVPVVASVALARMMERAGAVAVIAEGTESGGHVGEMTTMALVPQVVDTVDIPVIAAGGIADGRGVAAVFMLLVFAYYMYRTGNSTTTSARELAFRNFLENTLIARPRTKEMIVGWPMLMLFIWSLRRRMKFLPMIFGTGMTIGLVSVVNTFLHIRTPFLLSLLRTGWGILFGLLIGTAVVIVAELIYRLVRRICGVTNG